MAVDTGALSLADVRAAADRIAPYVLKTPTLSGESVAGPGVWLKAENLQRTGSFKVRGAVNAVLQLTDEQRRRGVITLSAGNHFLSAAYSGDANYTGGTSAAVNQQVAAPTPVTSATTLTSSALRATVGQAVTFTASVSPAGAAGPVTFKDGSQVLGTGLLSGGKVTFSFSFSTRGAHTLTAVYSGDASFASSVSSAFVLNVM